MRARFLGNIEAKMDAKGRVFFPATFRKMLQALGEEQLVVRKDIHQDCLVVYPKSVWDERVDALMAHVNEWDKNAMMVVRQYMKEVEETTLDGNGRLLIGKRYLDMVGIDQTVRFIGVNNTIEIWAAEKAEEPFLSQEEFSERLMALMAPQQGVTPAQAEH